MTPIENDPYASKPWLQSYAPGTPYELHPESLASIDQVLEGLARAHGERLAFSCGREQLSYSELQGKARAFAGCLRARGCVPRDRIALMMPNVLAFPVTLFGVLTGGFVATCVNPLYTSRELVNQVRDAGAKVLVVLDEFLAVVSESAPLLDLSLVIVATDGGVGAPVARHAQQWRELSAIALADVLSEGETAAHAGVETRDSDTALLQYTGGTTGRSKAAVLTHRNIRADSEMMRVWLEPSLRRSSGEAQLVMISALPLYHIYALNCCCILSVLMGAHSVLIRNPRDIDGLIDRLAETEFHLIWGVNALYASIINHERARSIDFSHLAISVGGGSAMQPATAEAWKRLSGVHMLQGYGMTETSPCITLNRPDEPDFNGAVGYPLPSIELSIRDEDGKPDSAPKFWPGDDAWEGSALVMWSGFDLRPRNFFDRTPFYPYPPAAPAANPNRNLDLRQETAAGAQSRD